MNLRFIVLFSLCCLLVAILGLTFLKSCDRQPAGVLPATEKRVVVCYDTVRVVRPVLRDSVVLRYVTARLPLVADSMAHSVAEVQVPVEADSALVAVPVSQKVYADSAYTAWVSGYMPQLDSIHIYNKSVFVTEQIEVLKRRRWGFSLGPAVGVGWSGRGLSPFVGVALSFGYNF